MIASTADNVEAAIRSLFATCASPRDALSAAIELVAGAFDQRQDFGCAIAPAVLEASGNRSILDVADDAFTRWQRAIREGLEAFGDDASAAGPDASAVSALVVASLEGAIILSRAAGSSLPIRQVGVALATLVAPAGPVPQLPPE